MRAVALISGGKDSCYNMMQCIAAGHDIVALANLQPRYKDDLDSFMYQTVGHQGIELYGEAMGLPLYREEITGVAIDQGRNYQPTENDEVEDLFRLISRIKDELNIEAVAVGAILSDYQRIRVENVCRRLDLVALAYLWRRNQKELLQEMIASGVEAVIIKVAALGLDPRKHLGLTLKEIQPHLTVMAEKYGLNVCGEGGEYETFTLDCPLFTKRLVIDEKEVVISSDDSVAPVGYLNLKLHLEAKENYDVITLPPTMKTSKDFINYLSDISDADLSETELESIEKLEKEEMKRRKEEEDDASPMLTYSGDNVDIDEENMSVDDSVYEFSDSDIQPVVDHRTIHGNKHGWYFIGGIVGEGVDTADATEDAMKKLINLLSSEDLFLPDVCSVNIYTRDMGQYSELNRVYAKHFCYENPPARVCVECPLPKDVGLIMDAVCYKWRGSEGSGERGGAERVTMHVQSISHWAPANIGPYSQAVKVGETVVTCGCIALVPGWLSVAGPPPHQTALALRHLSKLLRAAHPRTTVRSVVQSVCYVRSGGTISHARRQLERRTAGAMSQFAVVTNLPRDAAAEWHAWAHSDNNRFDYEETGCDIGDYKVAITRRWNYENTVAAFVCCVATGSSPSTCLFSFPSAEARAQHESRAALISHQQIQQVLLYALEKLLDQCPHVDTTASAIRIFYQVSSAPPPSVMLSAIQALKQEHAVARRSAFTLVPVLGLHNAFTFLSISGLRIDE